MAGDKVAIDSLDIDRIVGDHRAEANALIQILLDIQRQHHWLPRDALLQLSRKLDIPLAQVYHIATFYTAFSLFPRGRHTVSVCMGTACHVRGSPRILDKTSEALGIRPGQTTDDGKFSLVTVNCLGCCALGPVVVVDDEYHGRVAQSKVEAILSAYD